VARAHAARHCLDDFKRTRHSHAKRLDPVFLSLICLPLSRDV
jgi:hypothetical protein